MNKKFIRLTEGDLHRIVKESVKRIINEGGELYYSTNPDVQTTTSRLAKRADMDKAYQELPKASEIPTPRNGGYPRSSDGLERIYKSLKDINKRINSLTIGRTETHAVGGGEWSIEVYDVDGGFMKEFVGGNGTQDGYTSDLWAEYDEWYNEEIAPELSELISRRDKITDNILKIKSFASGNR